MPESNLSLRPYRPEAGNMWKIGWFKKDTGEAAGGEVPDMLKGQFTHADVAQNLIDVRKKSLAVKGSKRAKGSTKQRS